MKKLSLLMAGLLIGAASATAAAPKLPDYSGMKISVTEEQRAGLLKMQENAAREARSGSGRRVQMQRSWMDPAGNIWKAQVLKESKTLPEMVTFTDDKGESVNYTFDQMPYYLADYILTMEDAKYGNVVTAVQLILCWPSKYIWEQVFSYDGELDSEGSIPVEKRDYSCVTLDELANSTQWCREFRENGGVGSVTEDGTSWQYFCILPCKTLGIWGMVDGEYGYTTFDESKMSTLKFDSFDKTNDNLCTVNRIYFTGDNGKAYNIDNRYDGTTRLEGFESKTYDLPEFGDIHIFNAGNGSSDILGDNDPFTEKWQERSIFYIFAADKYLPCKVAESATRFDDTKINVGSIDLPEGEKFDDHANLIQGYLFTDPKYGKDTSLDPTEIIYSLRHGEVRYDPYIEDNYYSIYPEGDCFFSGGVNENWSSTYGSKMMKGNYSHPFSEKEPFTIAFGTKEGWIAKGVDDYTNKIIAKSTGKIIYHYDPNDMHKTREFSSIGALNVPDDPVDPDNPDIPVTKDDVQLTISTVNGPSTIVTCKKNATGWVSFDIDEYWTVKSLLFNMEDMTKDLVNNEFTTPKLNENSRIDAEIAYAGELKIIEVSTGVATFEGSNVTIGVTDSAIEVKGTEAGDGIVVYSVAGQIVTKTCAESNFTRISLEKGGVYLVRVGDKAAKVIL